MSVSGMPVREIRAAERSAGRRSISLPDGWCIGSGDEAQGGIQVRSAVPLILCAGIRHSIGAEHPIPEEVNDTKIAVCMPVMNKVQVPAGV